MKHDFAAAGLETPALDARMLLQGVLGIDASELVMRSDAQLGPDAPRLCDAARRRLDREPVSRILGRRGFYGLEFVITPDTLDPRPDSETLIDLVLAIVEKANSGSRPLKLLDYGTGTGCLLTTLLRALPQATGIGADVCPRALAVARQNADRVGVSNRAEFIAADGLRPLLHHAPFDIVISNPPYIPNHELAGLEPEVAHYDPHLALDGGEDGLAHYRRIASSAAALAPHGWIVVEVGAGQAAEVEKLVQMSAFRPADLVVMRRSDLAGQTRCVAWQPQSQP